MKKFLCAILFMAAALLCFRQKAMAAQETKVFFQAGELKEDTKNWEVTCKIDGGVKITNGKIRIHYDRTKLKFVSAKPGSLLGSMISNINDPIKGNRYEGEVLLVFAALSSTDAKGELLELCFEPVAGQIKKGDSITISASTEELSLDDSKVAVKDVPLEVKVAGDPDTGNSGSGNDGSSGGQLPDGTGSPSTNPSIHPQDPAAKISLKAPKIKKAVSTAKAKVTLKWKKVKKAEKYEIQIAKNKKFTKKVKTVNVKKNTLSKKIKVKGGGKGKYYVRIRAFKTVNNDIVYSPYSTVKTVRVK